MPPKPPKKGAPSSAAGGGGSKSEDERPDVLQALILADSFETRFAPLTLERPRCLLPLANTPLIEYTLEFLANSGVEEVLVYCGAHTDLVEEYLSSSRWAAGLPSSPFARLEVVRGGGAARSIGDAMRDLDARAAFGGDFVVVYGDVVANVPLERALAEHRARRIKDKNAIMTMVLREAGAGGNAHRARPGATRPVFVIDPAADRCVHFEQLPNRDGRRHLSLDPALLAEHPELDVRADLVDCGIDICTPDVLALWSDNFDFELPRRGFLHSVLKDYELNGKTVHAHVARSGYAARVRSLRAYDAVSRDVLGRWAYPLCPDSNLVRGQSFRLGPGGVYKEDGVVLARSCAVGAHSAIGRGTSVGEGTRVRGSVVGRGCAIGKGVVLEGAYVWDGAAVGNGSVVRGAVIADGATVGRGCRVEAGAIVSFGVRLADGARVSGRGRVTRAAGMRADGGEAPRGEPDPAVVGEGGDGFEYEDGDEAEEDGEAVERLVADGGCEFTPPFPQFFLFNHAFFNPLPIYWHEIAAADYRPVYNHPSVATHSASSISTLSSIASSTSSAHDLTLGTSPTTTTTPLTHIRTSSTSASLQSTSPLPSPVSTTHPHPPTRSHSHRHHGPSASPTSTFDHDATSSLHDSLARRHDPAAVLLELTSLRMATDASEAQVRRAVAAAFAKRLAELVSGASADGADPAPTPLQAARQLFAPHRALLRRTMFDRGGTAGSGARPDQVDFLLRLQAECARRAAAAGGDGLLVAACTELYNLEVVEEEGLRQWWDDGRSGRGGEAAERARRKVGPLLEALEAQSEESDGDEDEDEDEDGEE